MFDSLLTLVLQVLVLLIIVPAVTGGNVAIRQGGFFRGLLILVCIGIVNWMLWPILTIFTLGMVLVFQAITYGLVGIVINALAFRIAGGMSTSFHVKSFGSALVAAITMAIANVGIHMLIFQ